MRGCLIAWTRNEGSSGSAKLGRRFNRHGGYDEKGWEIIVVGSKIMAVIVLLAILAVLPVCDWLDHYRHREEDDGHINHDAMWPR
jgi:hypothetical protein